MKKLLTGLGVSLCFLTMVSCSSKPEEAKVNELTEQEKKDGWVSLFDGKTTDGWHLYNKGKVASAWVVQDSTLHCRFDTTEVEHGDLVSDKEFENFDLKFEWKIPKEGNSGVFINVVEKPEIPTAWASAPEYQLLEASHPDYATSPKKRAGGMFNLFEQKNPVSPKPVGEWNQSEIKQTGGKIEFYLNGVLTVQEDLTNQAWKDLIASTGFQHFPEFGKATKGRIGLQEWSKGISFRNIKIKTL